MAYTGAARDKKSKARVKLADALAGLVIAIGGIGTIVAVATVCVFLVFKVVPLFLGGEVKATGVPADLRATEQGLDVVRIESDEYTLLTLAVDNQGKARVYDAGTGKLLNERELFAGREPTSWSFAENSDGIAVGFADGSVAFGELGFKPEYLEEEAVPDEYRDLEPGDAKVFEDGLLERTVIGQYRVQRLKVSLSEPVMVQNGDPIIGVDHVDSERVKLFAAVTASGAVSVYKLKERKNLLTGKVTLTPSRGKLPELPARSEAPLMAGLTSLGDNVWVLYRDGRIIRCDARHFNDITIAETVDALPDASVTAYRWMNGKATLLLGDDQGRVTSWWRRQAEKGVDQNIPSDFTFLVKGSQTHDTGEAPVTALDTSSRTRLVIAGTEDGRVELFNQTNGATVAQVQVPDATGPVGRVALAPKDNGFIAKADGEIHRWELKAPHHDVSSAALIAPVHYESRADAETVWQSSSGDDAFEPKYGLWPLIFGTLKATFYALVFGVPIALLAAIYTSEFLHPKAKAAIKPGIEMMASLPSVVLGFIAGLVIASVVEDAIMMVLLSMILVPWSLLLFARGWQLLPRGVGLRFSWLRLPFMFVALLFGVLLASQFDGAVERIFFTVEKYSADGELLWTKSDLKTWLSAVNEPGMSDRFVSSSTGGWMFLLLPLASIVVAWASSRFVNPMLRSVGGGWSEGIMGIVDIGRFIASGVVAVGLAWLVSAVVGFVVDARGGYIDTYEQRNALVVGFIMGFAIIPIIYTIAEDALSSVPEHLRAASLGSGATKWQTAIRVIMPTAMSGIFSAVMVGLGRAVGETMIVLMAAGNTPVLSMNIFEGFRTLSANIAVELPEAPVDGSHYRVLFLAGLVLFSMTFVLNTVAEVIRLRFRKRAFEL